MSNITNKTLGSLVCVFLLLPNAWAETFQHAPINPIPPVTAPTPAAPPSAPSVTASPAPVASPAAVTTAPGVARSAFTSAIAAREPTNQLTRINAGQQVYYFTELVGLQGRVVNHRWERDGAFQLGLQFPVTGSPWRVHSSKNISPNLPGTWTVTVQNDDGTILKRETLIVDPVVANAVSTPMIPPPAQPLTAIPPELQRQPAERPATPAGTPVPTATTPAATVTPPAVVPPPAAPTPAVPPSSSDKRPIWETLSR